MGIPRPDFLDQIVVTTPAELQTAVGQPRALIFFSVDWSVHSRLSEGDVVATAQAWQNATPSRPAPLYRIDLTTQRGDLWDAVSAWLQAENLNTTLMVGGAGTLFWIRNGHPVDHVVNAHYEGKQTLLEKTRTSFLSR